MKYVDTTSQTHSDLKVIKKGKYMKKRTEVALSQFDKGFNCAQSVVMAFKEELGVDHRSVLRLTAGFGGGIGKKGEVCGAVTGGVMVIGARHGTDVEKEAVATTQIKTRELLDSFSEKHGTYYCRELTMGCDLATEEGQKTFRTLELKDKVCKQCITSVVQALDNTKNTP